VEFASAVRAESHGNEETFDDAAILGDESHQTAVRDASQSSGLNLARLK
jgi:hypothetical protein